MLSKVVSVCYGVGSRPPRRSGNPFADDEHVQAASRDMHHSASHPPLPATDQATVALAAAFDHQHPSQALSSEQLHNTMPQSSHQAALGSSLGRPQHDNASVSADLAPLRHLTTQPGVTPNDASARVVDPDAGVSSSARTALPESSELPAQVSHGSLARARSEQQGIARGLSQGSVPPAPVRSPLRATLSTERLVPRRAPPTRPGPGPAVLPEGSGDVVLPRRAAPGPPGPEPALALEEQGLSSMLQQDLPSTSHVAARQGESRPGESAGPSQAPGLEGMLGSPMPDSHYVEEDTGASEQDRQKFMQSLQSPEKGSKTKNWAKGFGSMRAKAKDMLQARNAGAGGSAGQGVLAGEAPMGAPQTAPDAGLGRGSKLARDMTTMFAGLKKPANQ